MPSRLYIGVILAFWLTMTGWLIQREVVPMMLADAAPTFQIDLTQEIEWTDERDGKRVGSAPVFWTVEYNQKRVGRATSQVVAHRDRSYEFRSLFHFDGHKFKVGPASISAMENTYRITEDGKLVSLSATVDASFGKVGIQGEVVNGFFESRVFAGAFEQNLDKVDLPQEGSIVNPMHLVNRVRGLHEGRTWKITLLDPFRGLTEKFVGKGMTIPALIAVVRSDTMSWDHKEVACYKIEYHEVGKDVVGRTWVRRSDGLVLKQESSHHGFELILQRVP
jgi:hypothetical protein